MPLTSLTSVLEAAQKRGGAVLGLVCLSWEDAVEFVAAGNATGVPVVLQAGPAARAAIPTDVWGKMFRTLADDADVPVVAHLDHGRTLEECQAAIDAGFTSVMIDGSRLSLSDNISLTNEVREKAHGMGVSLEAEVGFVGYAGGAQSEGTKPGEAIRFARETGVDAMAVSVGNVHLTQAHLTPLDWKRLEAIRKGCSTPLVLHGGSGVPPDHRARAAQEFGVCKINVGTEIRQAYGVAIRKTLDADEHIFDRLEIARRIGAERARMLQDLLSAAWSSNVDQSRTGLTDASA